MNVSTCSLARVCGVSARCDYELTYRDNQLGPASAGLVVVLVNDLNVHSLPRHHNISIFSDGADMALETPIIQALYRILQTSRIILTERSW